MIKEYELDEAIAECIGQKNPNAQTCIKLAAFYTLKEHLYPKKEKDIELPVIPSYSTATQGDVVLYEGDSEFSQAIYNKDSDQMWAIMDELMTTLAIVNPRLYDSAMRRIAE